MTQNIANNHMVQYKKTKTACISSLALAHIFALYIVKASILNLPPHIRSSSRPLRILMFIRTSYLLTIRSQLLDLFVTFQRKKLAAGSIYWCGAVPIRKWKLVDAGADCTFNGTCLETNEVALAALCGCFLFKNRSGKMLIYY